MAAYCHFKAQMCIGLEMPSHVCQLRAPAAQGCKRCLQRGFLFIFLPPNGMDGSGFEGLHWREFTADDVQSAPPALEHACTAVVSVCASPCQSREGDTALPLHWPTELPRRRHAITIDIAPRADVCHAPKKPTPGNGEPPHALHSHLLCQYKK